MSCSKPLDIILTQMYFSTQMNFFSGANRGIISLLANVISDFGPANTQYDCFTFKINT